MKTDGRSLNKPQLALTALGPNTKHDSYTKVNARIGIASVDDTWSVAFIGRNLTDKETRV